MPQRRTRAAHRTVQWKHRPDAGRASTSTLSVEYDTDSNGADDLTSGDGDEELSHMSMDLKLPQTEDDEPYSPPSDEDSSHEEPSSAKRCVNVNCSYTWTDVQQFIAHLNEHATSRDHTVSQSSDARPRTQGSKV